MRGLFTLAMATVVSLITPSLAAPIVVNPGGTGSLQISELNTVNGTSFPINAVKADNPLRISVVNNFGGTSMHAWVTGQDTNGVVVMLSTDGTWYYPNPLGSTTPIIINATVAHPLGGLGETTEFTLPDFLISGRIWIADGELTFFTVSSADGNPQLVEPSAANPRDPSANINWGFVELTNTSEGGIYANISFVDFVGLVMGMTLTLNSGEVQKVQGLGAGAIADICNGLKAQSAIDGAEWGHMCVMSEDGTTPLRVMAPNLYLSNNPTAMYDYYTDYTEQVWAKYTNEDLTIQTQVGAGNVTCRVSSTELTCDGDNRGYPKPTTADIWGCNSGPFAILEGDNDIHSAIVPRLCAAFTRTTLLVDGGDVQPSLSSDSYYQQSPTNHYSRLVHEYETDGRGYAFSYDDVNPSSENEAGVVAGANPQVLQLTVGGFSSS
ncbi:Uu.00g145610.m01.CDS01 [Anthostomella pinea]|uniref:Uu.00g145610.m01.CDS01 n=1 Tax=Anthostomella pinea TaxID=933095 RepID=A0AAI8VKL0_9PEZI|nr:Uu.00g145610.m01.CDS01 [Anthostomella pinea]